MDYTAIVMHVIDRIPAAMFIMMVGVLFAILVGYLIHKSKKFPYKIIKTGTNGKTLVTADYLKTHCKEVHESLNETLQEFMNVQKDMQIEVKEIGQSMAFIQGKLSVKRK
jgi:hypothetical protein